MFAMLSSLHHPFAPATYRRPTVLRHRGAWLVVENERQWETDGEQLHTAKRNVCISCENVFERILFLKTGISCCLELGLKINEKRAENKR